MQQLHDLILGVSPGCKLWFLDGRNAEGKVVSNPDIGYGSRDHKCADATVSDRTYPRLTGRICSATYSSSWRCSWMR